MLYRAITGLTFDGRRITLISRGFNVPQKPTRQRDPGKEQDEFGNFTNLLDRLLAVPHSKIKEKLDAEKTAKRTRTKRVSSVHASGETD
jgi:hypothetical protein